MKYTVLSRLDHDNKEYKPKSTIELDDEAAATLLKLKVVELVAVDQTRATAIQEAIGKLDKSNADLWLKDGKPAQSAIETFTGWPITAAERDEAWSTMQG